MDVAEAALYLCEPASRFTTGAELVVDGGWCVSEGTPPDDIPSEREP
jgi:NAD(P)-dependent dehydrogenase (short-subunit alcohol dehydrogenase family)